MITYSAIEYNVIPVFLQPGVGPTLLGRLVLALSIARYALSSLFLLKVYLKTRSEILYFYSLALGFLALGHVGGFLSTAVGSLISWTGRSGAFLAALNFLLAVLTSLRLARTSKNP
ncbi:MAG: hypothetical protein HY619_00100 [Thaumarchaeota archaeon]|nr:hypothetical protein [Nitrososphaerota archaeon]